MGSSELSPDQATALVAKSHREAGRFDDAEALVAEALAKHPTSRFLLAESADIAGARHDYSEAARRWQLACERVPNWFRAVIAYNRSLAIVANRDIDTGAEESVSRHELEYRHSVRPDGDRLRKIFMQFESLGDGCEFGFIQRQFGAEPLGLFRWTGISSWDLVRALDNGLKEISEAVDARLVWQREAWFVTVPGAGFETHTFVEPDDPERFLPQMRRRLRYLSQKMLEDLRDGEKVFVFKGKRWNLTEDEIGAIHAAVRRHGRGRLLCVCGADDGHPPGTLEARNDGLWVGRVRRTVPADDQGPWLALCSGIAEGRAIP